VKSQEYLTFYGIMLALPWSRVMEQPRLSLNVLEVSSPCRVPWKSMSGTNQVRYCGQCRKSVYNLSAMTSADAEELLSGPETPCVRFYRRLDGTVVTSDRCGNRVNRVWQRVAGAFAALLVGVGAISGCSDQGKVSCKSATQGAPTKTSRSATPAEQPAGSVKNGP
jgi:hypothetical protein